MGSWERLIEAVGCSAVRHCSSAAQGKKTEDEVRVFFFYNCVFSIQAKRTVCSRECNEQQMYHTLKNTTTCMRHVVHQSSALHLPDSSSSLLFVLGFTISALVILFANPPGSSPPPFHRPPSLVTKMKTQKRKKIREK